MRISDWSSDVCSSDLTETFTTDLTTALSGRLDTLEGQTLDSRITAVEGLVGDVDFTGSSYLGPATDLTGAVLALDSQLSRSEERRVGKECGGTSISRWSPYQ